MNLNPHRKAIIGVVTLAIVLTSMASRGQSIYTQRGATQITIAGTSTLHEWTMVSSEVSYEAAILSNAEGNPVSFKSITVSLPARSLKSGKAAMDKNAYTALKTDANKLITFQLVSAGIEGTSIKCTGKLTIAGTTKQTEVEATYAVLGDNSLQCKGSKKFLMTDFNVEPPSFMFGSVTTGNEITVTFDVVLTSKKTQPITLN